VGAEQQREVAGLDTGCVRARDAAQRSHDKLHAVQSGLFLPWKQARRRIMSSGALLRGKFVRTATV